MSELGNKHECLGCNTKFYDLGKTELVCPKCGENQKDLAAAQDSSASKAKAQRKKPAKKKKKATKKVETANTDADEDVEPVPTDADEELEDAGEKK